MRKAVIGSFILAVLHSVLFYGQDFGVSVLLFMIPSVFLLIQMLKKHDRIRNQKALYLVIPILLLSSTYFIFNQPFFHQMNLLVIPILLGSMIVWACLDEFKLRQILGKSINLVIGSLEYLPHGCKVIKHTFFVKQKKEKAKHEKIKYIIIGMICSIPLLFIIIGLLISADGVFAELFHFLFVKIEFLFTSQMLSNLIGRIFVITLVTVYLVCIVFNIINKNTEFNKEKKLQNMITPPSIEPTIINTILTIMNITYAIFSCIQFVYLFGDNILTKGMNLAEFARQGFFQLMWITLINFAVILFANCNQKAKDGNKDNYSKFMSICLCVFTIIIAVSAFLRMNLYEKEYGYTFLRLMVYVILLTEISMIVPTVLYILKGKINLLKSYFIIITSVYVVVNFANIDLMIAKKNVNRYLEQTTQESRKIDINYLCHSLSTDAIPEILRLYDNLQDEEEKNEVNNYLYYQKKDLDKKEISWQEFNVSIQKAKDLLKNRKIEYQYVDDVYDQRYYNEYYDIRGNRI